VPRREGSLKRVTGWAESIESTARNGVEADMTLNDPVSGSASSLPDLLLVEDNALHARLVTTMLADIWPQGVPLRHVKRLEGALEAIRDSRPDCVLLDLVLPDASNLEAVDALVAAYPAIPIVVLSSHQDEAMAVLAIQAGAQDFLVKGTATAESLGKAIRYAVQRRGTPEPVVPAAAPGPAAAAPETPGPEDDGAPGHAILDAEGRMLYAGPEVADLLGRSLDQIVGIPLHDLAHPADHGLWDEAFAAARTRAAGEEGEDVLVRYLHPSGADIRVRVALIALHNAAGEPSAFLATLHPTSEEGTASSGAYAVLSEWSAG
jgi:two-component system sensor histidine kinase UhpB